jgi:hypothetical protein
LLHEIGVELAARIGSKGCPFAVYDGPERRPTTTFGRERIVIEHDPNGDSFPPRHRADTNPRTRLTRVVGVKVTIYAQAATKGSIYWEHKRRAEHVLDMVLCGLDVVVKERANILTFRSGKFVDPPDLKPSETPGGAVYELYVTIDRGVADRNWDGTAGPTATVTPQLIGGPALVFTAASHTIARSFGSWLLDGFAVGQKVIVSGTASNNGTVGPITALTDSTMTFGSGLVNESQASAMVTGTGTVVHNTFQVNESGETTETA